MFRTPSEAWWLCVTLLRGIKKTLPNELRTEFKACDKPMTPCALALPVSPSFNPHHLPLHSPCSGHTGLFSVALNPSSHRPFVHAASSLQRALPEANPQLHLEDSHSFFKFWDKCHLVSQAPRLPCFKRSPCCILWAFWLWLQNSHHN